MTKKQVRDNAYYEERLKRDQPSVTQISKRENIELSPMQRLLLV